MTSRKRALKRKLLILKKFSPVFMLVLTCVVLILLINVERKPYRGRLNEGDVCLTAVYAPFNFSYPGRVDEERTEAKRQEYISRTGWVYNIDQDQSQKILSQSELFFKNLKETRALDISAGEKISKLNEATGLDLSDSALKTFLTEGKMAKTLNNTGGPTTYSSFMNAAKASSTLVPVCFRPSWVSLEEVSADVSEDKYSSNKV